MLDVQPVFKERRIIACTMEDVVQPRTACTVRPRRVCPEAACSPRVGPCRSRSLRPSRSIRTLARRLRILSMSVFTAAPPGIASARRQAPGLRPPRLAARVRSPRSIRSLNGFAQVSFSWFSMQVKKINYGSHLVKSKNRISDTVICGQ